MANSIQPITVAGTYTINVTIKQGCTIDFDKPSGVDIKQTSAQGGKYTFELTVNDGVNGTITPTVNGNPCNDYKIKVNTAPVQTCECSYLSVTPNTNISNAGGNVTAATYNSTVAGCLFNVTVVNVSPNNGWLKNVSASNGVITGTAEANTGEARDVIIAITGTTSDGKECTGWATIKATQQASGCKCENLKVSPASHTWEANDDSSKTYEFTITSATCITNISKNSLSYFNATFGNGVVTVAPKNTNPGEQPHIETLIISYKAGTNTCSSAITLTQKPIGCTCDDITFDTEECDWNAGQTDPKRRYYTIGDCITVGDIYESPEHIEDMGHFSAQTFVEGSSTYIAIWPTIANTRIEPYNSTLHVKFLKDGAECVDKEITLTHNACECDVTFDTTYCNWESNQTDPKRRYYTTSDCVTVGNIYESPEHIEDMGHFSAQTVIDGSGSYVAIWPAIVNTRIEPYNSTLHVKFLRYGVECEDKEITLKHDGAGCTCENAFVSAVMEELPTKIVGGDVITVWKVDKTCGQLYAITEGNCVASSGVYESGGYYYVSAKTSDVSSSCDFKVGYQLNVNGEICTNATGMSDTITVEPAIECDCRDLIVIARESEEVDWEEVDWGKNVFLESVDEEYTFTYIFNQGKEACFEGTDVTFSYDSTDAEYFIINTGKTTDGKSFIKIKPNPNKDPNQIDIYFDYALATGKNCGDGLWTNFITVIYNPACKCKELLPDDACIQRQVSTAADTYPLGTFGVVGCGEFSGISTSSQVDKVIITESDDGYDVSVKLYEFTPTTSQPDAPIDIDIFSLESGQALADCHHIYRIWQKEDYVNCARVRKINFVDDNPAYTSNVNAFLAKLDDDDGFIAFSALSGSNIITSSSFSTEHDWIDASTINFFVTRTTIYLRGKIEANPSAKPRTNTITINYNKDKLRQIYGICEDCINQPFTVTVTQQGDESLNCNCLGPKEIEIRYFGAESSFNSDNLRNDCFVSTGLKFTPIGTIVPGYESAFSDPSAFFTEDNYVAVNNWLSINLDVRSYTTSPEKCYLHVAYKALANTGSERDYAFKIKLNYDSAKQSEECIWEIKFTQEAVIDVTCQQLLDSIKTYSIDVQATKTRDGVAYMRPVLRDDVRLSGVTVQSQGCGDTSWITKIEPGSGNNTDTLYIENTVNKSTERDHSTTSRCAKISVFFIDSEGNRLKINGVQCGEKEITVTQEGYSGDCMACDDAIPKLPIPAFTSYRDTTYESGGKTFSAFYEGNGETDRSLFEIPIPYDYYYDSIEANRCFDLIAKTTHHGSFTPYPDGEYLHVELDESNKKWIIHGMIKPTSEPVNTVAVEVYLQRRNLAGGDSTQCESTSYVTDFVILKKQ